jgi:hypothetical protein
MSNVEVTVFIAQGDLEAEQVCAFLEAHGVATMVRGEALRKTHGMVLNGLGEVKIQVPAEQEDVARDLLERVEQGDLALAEDQDP